MKLDNYGEVVRSDAPSPECVAGNRRWMKEGFMRIFLKEHNLKHF